jgi:hypothetical protein
MAVGNQSEVKGCTAAIAEFCGFIVYGRTLWEILDKPSERTFLDARKAGRFADLRFRPIPRQKGVYCSAADIALYFVTNNINWQERLKKVKRPLFSPSRARRIRMKT